MSGNVGILNVGAGDTKLSFDPNSPQDCIRAARIVKDMLRRGYALLVDSGRRDASDRPIFTRAYDFDETKCEYIIADFDPVTAAKSDAEEDADEPSATPGEREGIEEGGAERPAPKGKRGRPRKRVPASTVNAVAVARSAGG